MWKGSERNAVRCVRAFTRQMDGVKVICSYLTARQMQTGGGRSESESTVNDEILVNYAYHYEQYLIYYGQNIVLVRFE